MFAGRNLKVFIDGALIAAVKTKSISLNREAIDETDGESNGWQFFNEIPDGRDMAVSVEGVATFDNFSLLEEFEYTGEELPSLVLEFPNETVLTSTGGAFLQSLAYQGEHVGAVQFSAVFLLSGPASAVAIPILTSIDPNEVEEDSGDFVMTLTGLNFEPTSVAEIDGMEISTVYVSPTELTATVPGSAITDPGTIAVTVSTPGVGTSSAVTLTVTVAATYAVFDPATISAGAITLSGGNLTATRGAAAPGSNRSVRVTNVGKSTGKWYFEAHAVIGGGGGPNFVNGFVHGVSDSGLSGLNYVGQTIRSWGYQFSNIGALMHNNAGFSLFAGSGYLVGDTVMVAIDLDASKIWWGANGTWFSGGNPALGSGNWGTLASGITYYPALSMFDVGQQATYNFGATPFAYGPPAGFNPGWYQ